MKLDAVIKSAAFVASLSLATFTARADIVIDTGAPPTDPDGGRWLLGNDGDFEISQDLAAKFSLPGTTIVTDIEGWLKVTGGGGLAISLAADGGLTPGAVLFTTTVTLTANLVDTWRGVSGLNWKLDAGSYWVIFAGSGINAGMRNGAPNALDTEAYANVTDGKWYNLDDLDIGVRIQSNVGNSHSVPERSSSVILFGMAIACLLAINLRLGRA